ncbi:hypothetical protein HY380_00690 [Candidatus Saccharibacteria bacterium]|nr:hypothetical protein [Candidatus Saccharibacteria bacterium]
MALKLPTSIIGQADVNRLGHELGDLNDFLAAARVRKAGTPVVPPGTTSLLDELAKTNKLNLLEETDRDKLAKGLEDLIAKAPKLRIAFAVDPPPSVLATLLGWLRQNIEPTVLLQVGLQPNIGAGCVLRTANREFDLSMRQHLISSKKQLTGLIQAAVEHYVPPAPPPSQAPTPNPNQPVRPAAPVPSSNQSPTKERPA